MPDPKVIFEREDIVEIIEELVDRLVHRGAKVRLRIVGGAAIMLQFDRDSATTDIDAAYGTSIVVEEVVAELAAERALQTDWLNNDFRGFLSDYATDDDWVAYISRGDVEVVLASASMLLAMKLLAGRGRRDEGDIDELITSCGCTSAAAVNEVFDRYYPNDAIKPLAARQVIDRFTLR